MGRGLLDALADGLGNLANLFSGCMISLLAGLLMLLALFSQP
jgi:hypothetical protein